MKVFLSWAGDASEIVATALNDAIPSIIQRAETFFSPEMDRGINWFNEISSNLAECEFGILCLTRENMENPWILFEAGALAKQLGKNPVVPLLIDFSPTELKAPLSQFNAATLEEGSMKQLFLNINDVCKEQVSKERLEGLFKHIWSELKDEFEKAKNKAEEVSKDVALPERSQKDILEEVLQLTRKATSNSGAILSRLEGEKSGLSLEATAFQTAAELRPTLSQLSQLSQLSHLYDDGTIRGGVLESDAIIRKIEELIRAGADDDAIESRLRKEYAISPINPKKLKPLIERLRAAGK